MLVLKSGSEFRDFSILTVKFPVSKESRPVIDVRQCKVTREDPPDEAMTAIVQKYLSKVRLCSV